MTEFLRAVLLVVLMLGSAPARPVPPTPAVAVNQYGVAVVTSARQYAALAARDHRQYLVDLASFIPNLRLDLMYATAHNPTGRPLYRGAHAYLRLPVAEALRRVQADLAHLGLGLEIWDAYRPYSVTLALWQAVHNVNFVAPPSSGSVHNRGAAVDLTLVNLKTGREVPMPTPYDSFGPATSPTYQKLSARVLADRDLLNRVMTRHGFVRLTTEWWHFELTTDRHFPTMDVGFEAIGRVRLPADVAVRYPLFALLWR